MSPRRSLTAFWFLYFAGFGIYFPYFSLYLRENAGLSGTEVGLVLSTWPLVGILVQSLWGQVADRTGARGWLLALAGIGTGIGFLVLGLASSFAQMLAASAFLAFFGTAVLPGLFAVSMAVLEREGSDAFGRTRVWGTVSFLLTVVSFPWILDAFQSWSGLTPIEDGPSEPGLGIMFPIVAGFTLLAAATAVGLPRAGTLAARAQPGDWRILLGHLPMRRLLVFAFFAYAFLQGPMVLFPVYVADRGGTIDTVGQMWVLMLLLEIPIVAYSGSVLRRIGARGLMQLGVAIGGLRWLICGLTNDMAILFPLQGVHAIIVAGLMLSAPLYLEAVVPDRLRTTGQSLLATIGVGVGGIVSNSGSGWLLENVGIDAVYLVGGAGAVLLALGSRRLLPDPRRPMDKFEQNPDTSVA